MGFSRSTPAQGDPCAGPVDQQQAAGRQPSPGPKSPSLGQRLSGAPPKPAPTRWRLRSRRRRDVGRSIDSTFGALGPRSGLHQFPAVPTRHSLHDPEFKRLLQVWPDLTNHAPPTTPRPKAPPHEPQPVRLRRGRIGRNGGQVFNLPPNVSTPGRNVSTLGRNVSTFANQVFTFPDPTVVRSASSGPLLPNPGRPSAYLFPGSRPPPTGRARHPGRETPDRTIPVPAERRWPYPVRGEPTGSLRRACPEPVEGVVSNHTALSTQASEPIVGPTPFVVSRGGVFGRSCRTTQATAPKPPSQSSAPPRSW